MLRRSIIALSLVGLVAGAGVALADDGQRAGRHAHGTERLQHYLGLTDEQATAIKAVFEKHREEQKQTGQALEAARNEVRQLALNNADTAAKMGEVQRLLGQTETARVKLLQEIGSLLTPEQRAKFAQVDSHRGMRHHRKPPPAQS